MDLEILRYYPDRHQVIDFVRERHGDQKRIHGGPYYMHPLAVTEIAFHNLGVTRRAALIAGDCHDLLEDTQTTYDELLSLYGVEVADMVKALTKPPKQQTFNDPMGKIEGTIEIYKSLRVAPYDARLIKIADRKHNLQEMQFTNRSFQHRYISDTVILMQVLKGYVDRQHFDELQFSFWQATAQFVG